MLYNIKTDFVIKHKKNMNDKDIKKELGSYIKDFAGGDIGNLIPLQQAGSDRRYFRFFAGSKSYIATFVPDAVEAKCFVSLANDFRCVGAAVPEILAFSPDFHCYIQEDLGDRSLFSELASEDSLLYIKETLSRLVELQKIPREVWQSDCMANNFCKRQVKWDLNYFKYEFLKPQETLFDEDRLEDDFDHLSSRLTGIPEKFFGFMMRDCQSRNVMLTERGPVFIDFQGGRWGPALYDAVSFLWQARAGFSNELRMKMLDYYCDCFCEGNQELKSEMLSALDDIVVFRTLQVLGAYGFRGLVQHRPHFLMSIPAALANLRDLLEKGALDMYPELKSCAESLASAESAKIIDDFRGLTVEIYSFSYKKGYPADLSGNGGGFMFDCRSMHNPGRYPEYKELTGRDQPVIDFLEKRGEVQGYLHNVWALTDAAIERYLSRGFTHLQIGFGCTGGQHRSVYCAEHTAEHVSSLFPEVKVNLTHREHPDS